MPPVLATGELTSLLRNYGKTGRYDIRDRLLGGICIPRSSEKLEHAKFVNGALPRSYADNARRGLFTSLDLYGAPQHVTTLSHGVNRLRRHPRGSERGTMHDPANGLPRIPLPRTPLNKPTMHLAGCLQQ